MYTYLVKNSRKRIDFSLAYVSEVEPIKIGTKIMIKREHPKRAREMVSTHALGVYDANFLASYCAPLTILIVSSIAQSLLENNFTDLEIFPKSVLSDTPKISRSEYLLKAGAVTSDHAVSDTPKISSSEYLLKAGAVTSDHAVLYSYFSKKYGLGAPLTLRNLLIARFVFALSVYKPYLLRSQQALARIATYFGEEEFYARFGLSRREALFRTGCAALFFTGGLWLWHSQVVALIGKKFIKSFSSKCIKKFVAENPEKIEILTKKLRSNKPIMILVCIAGFAFYMRFHRTGPIHVAPTGSRFTHPIPFASEFDTCYQQALIYLQSKIEEIRARLLKELEIDNEVLSPLWPTEQDLIDLNLMTPEREIIGFWCNCKSAVATSINACSPAPVA